MRVPILTLVGWLGVGGGVMLAQNQTSTSAASPSLTLEQQPPQTPAAPAPPPGQTAPATPFDSMRSLFAPTWRQAQISGRLSSVSGDPARFQRYEDIRDGFLFTDVR